MVLETPPPPPGEPPDRFMAQIAAAGVAGNARTLVLYAHGTFDELSLTDCVAVLKDTARGLNDGDLSAAVTMLSSQAVALNAIFVELARRAALNMGTHMGATESYMRLALKAQSQSRTTLETLAAIKNPPVVFARQANIAHGPQQVNNGPAPPKAEQYAPASAHPGETVSAPTELLEDCTHGSTPLDTRATKAASRTHPQLEPVGALDRPAHR